MRFSIIMPSFLGQYKSAAKNREKKIVRAINSALDQTLQDFELIIIADGCDKTIEIVNKIKSDKIRLLSISKQRIWSGLVRNTGLSVAKGEWIAYLDIDDMLGEEHLEIINRNITEDFDWFWFNEKSWDKGLEKFNERHCLMERGKIGTANVSHRKGLCGWNVKNTYLQDFNFVLNLMTASDRYKKIEAPRYLVCHVPGLLDYEGESKEISI